MKPSESLLQIIALNAFKTSTPSPAQMQEIESMNKECLWQHVCEFEEVSDACELHELHDEIYIDTTALDILDKVYTLLQKNPPQGMNVQYMNILLTTGRKEELLTYLDKFLQ